MKSKLIVPLFIALAAFVASATAASAKPSSVNTFHFNVIQNVDQSIKDTLYSQLYVEVWNDSDQQIRFSFRNDPDSDMIATSIYFADNTPFLNYDNPKIINNVSGVKYAVTDDDIAPGEVLDISFNYAPKNENKTYNYNQLIEALEDGSVDIRMQVQSIGGSFSGALTSSSSNMTPVPEPATMLLFGIGLTGIAATARKRKKL